MRIGPGLWASILALDGGEVYGPGGASFLYSVAAIHAIADNMCSRKPIFNSANLYALGSEVSAASHSNGPRWANNM